MENAFRGIDWGRALDELSDAIEDDRPHRATGAHAAHVVEILDAMAVSATEGRAVEVTSSFPSTRARSRESAVALAAPTRWQALRVRLPAHGSDHEVLGLTGSVPGLLVPADHVGVDAPRLGEVAREQLEAHDVDDRMRRRHEQRVAAELAERPHCVDGPLGRAALALEHEAAHRGIDRREVPVQELLRLVRLRGDVRALAELEDRLERRRRVTARAGDDEAVVRRDARAARCRARGTRRRRARSRPRPRSARPAATAHV